MSIVIEPQISQMTADIRMDPGMKTDCVAARRQDSYNDQINDRVADS